MPSLRLAVLLLLAPLSAQSPQANNHIAVRGTLNPRSGETYTAVTGLVLGGNEHALLTTQKNTVMVNAQNPDNILHIHNVGYTGPDDWKQIDTVDTTVGNVPTTYSLGVNGSPGDNATGFIEFRVVTTAGFGAPIPWGGGTAPFLTPHWLAIDKVTKMIGVCDPMGGRELVYQISPGALPMGNPENPAPLPAWSRNHFVEHSGLRNGRLTSVVTLANQVFEIRVRTGAGSGNGYQFTGPGTPHAVATTTNSAYALVASSLSAGGTQSYTLTLVNQSNGAMTALPNTTAVGPVGPAHGNSVHVVGNTAYVAYRTVGFKAFDLSALPVVPPAIMEYDNPIVGGQPDNLVSIYPGQPSGVIYALYERSGFRVLQPALNRTAYGVGSGGTPGIPLLTATPPYIGGSFTFNISNALPSTFGALLLGAAAANIPVFGFTLLVDPSGPYVSLGFAVSGAGTAALPLALPNNLSLLSISLFNQALVVDAGAPFGIAATQGLRLD